ncbi:MAG: hypothetical protein NUV74_12155 [Candidatus Brocadiaceae bacterium]|nr:hypothetical protein [Candidatus Brocadiaceae bacterium]
MIITRKILAHMLIKYINREIDLSNLINWAEDMIVDANFEDEHFELLRDILARIGFADVREFGLSWDDCSDYLHKLGYDIKVAVSEVS